MPRSKGYLLPQVIDPDEDICLAVHVPNDEGYIRAFWGIYEWLGYWFAWERDALKQGKDAAARWRLAVDRTHETFDRYGDLCTMEITVNCGGGCGCGPTYDPNEDFDQYPPTVYEDIFAIPPGLQDDGINPPTGNFVDYEEYLSYKCFAANALAEDLLDTFNRIGSFGGLIFAVGLAGSLSLLSTTSIASLFVRLLATFLTPVGALVTVLGLFGAVVGTGIAVLHYFGQLRGSLSKEDLVCGFYESANPFAARSSLIEQIETAYPGIEFATAEAETIFRDFVENLLDLVAKEELFNVVFDRVIGYQPSDPIDCAECGSVPGMTVLRGTYLGTDENDRHLFAPDHQDYDHNPSTGQQTCERCVEVVFDPPVTLTYMQSDPQLTQTIYSGNNYRTFDPSNSIISTDYTNAGILAKMPDEDCARVFAWARTRSTGHTNDWNHLILDWE